MDLDLNIKNKTIQRSKYNTTELLFNLNTRKTF